MKLGYDNLEDTKTKLIGTYCLHAGRAFTVKAIDEGPPGKYTVTGSLMANGRMVQCDVNDPQFNCSEYNIGYINRMNCAVWFYRIPVKQYKQGLRYDQVNQRASKRDYHGVEFKPSQALGDMLENKYPKFGAAATLLRQGEANILAFHRNWAMTWDRLHDDFAIEHKGVPVGCASSPDKFKLVPEAEHLVEALKEAMN